MLIAFKNTEVSKPKIMAQRDGELMVEIAPGRFLNAAAARRRGVQVKEEPAPQEDQA